MQKLTFLLVLNILVSAITLQGCMEDEIKTGPDNQDEKNDNTDDMDNEDEEEENEDEEENEEDQDNPDNTVSWETYIHGVDLSYVNQIEDHGGVYKHDGQKKDPYKLLADSGANMARFRLWHSPDWIKDIYDESTTIYSGREDVTKSLKRAKEAGMATLLDFHYSDTWADPGNQDVPKAWRSITDIEVLCDSVYNYTYQTLNHLASQDVIPEMVQIGNETNRGMMFTEAPAGFPNLDVYENNWPNFGKVANSAIEAVRQIEKETGKSIKIAFHIADPKNLEWWTNDLINKGKVSDFEIMGFSYYHLWHNDVSFSELPNVVTTVKNRFNKEILILETAYPFTTDHDDNYNNIYSGDPISGFPFTIEGQKEYLITLNQNMIEAGAMGVFYWEPAWISSNMKDLWGTGSSWENCAFFDFSGNVTEAVNYMNYDYFN